MRLRLPIAPPKLVRLARLKLAAFWFEAKCSVQLSYRRLILKLLYIYSNCLSWLLQQGVQIELLLLLESVNPYPLSHLLIAFFYPPFVTPSP